MDSTNDSFILGKKLLNSGPNNIFLAIFGCWTIAFLNRPSAEHPLASYPVGAPWITKTPLSGLVLKKFDLFKPDLIILDVWLGNKPTVNLIAQKDVISTLSFDQIKSIKSIIQYEKPVSSPFKAGDKLGSLTINISGKTPIIVPLVADKDIKNVNPFMKILAAIKYLMFGTSLDGI